MSVMRDGTNAAVEGGTMTRLTLEWHLRGIVEGTTEAEVVRLDITPGSHYKRREWSITKRYYGDPTDEERKRVYEEGAEAGSYTTGFTQESGDFCDAYDVPAWEALNSRDPVRFLDAVAHDPFRRAQERHDSAALLNYHIWPDSPRDTNQFADARRDDIDVREWTARKGVGPTYFSMRCKECLEGECLADPDIHRDEGRAVCMTCGTEQPVPEYP